MRCPHLETLGRPPRALRNPGDSARCVIAVLVLVALGAGCSTRSAAPAGTFIEEFEGFPIYHGEPERPYKLLGPVYNAEAAARGVSPMKRACVVEARRRGADAIIVGVAFNDHRTTEPQPDSAPATLKGKWRLAVAIVWK